ncbi:helix-turn-helix domain-containing protein [Epilithonimonas sp. JDS]|uniref:helix-turn-helix domain-containing protein n=1 Tax=Epilithonimonas sp. JDS TaxID=2902797 RepID=UPI001E4CB7B6|nr:helix-turn-helix domain-containing protein [Epilithonimonas sp. JDS]MCD9854530.1 helix-turn-helix domain-containing protein [Epilithonimonas sp. JDS]
MNKEEIIITALNQVLQEVSDLKERLYLSKKVFNVKDFSFYSGFKESHIYKLTSQGEIEFSKPNGKMVFFDKEIIDKYLLQNSVKARTSIESAAIEYAYRKK